MNKLVVSGFNSRLYQQLKHEGFVANIELERYSRLQLDGPATLLVFNDVPMEDCEKFAFWISDLVETCDIQRVVFCSSFVCDKGPITPYAKRKLHLENLLKVSIGSSLVILRLKNLILENGQWERLLQRFRKRLVINFSKKNVCFHFSELHHISDLLQDVTDNHAYGPCKFNTVYISREAKNYINFPLFESPFTLKALPFRIMEMILPVIIIAGTEYAVNED